MQTLLLVEDNEASRDALARRLERRNYRVLVAVDGEQAVAIARAEKPDLILMDLGLPGMDGYLLASKLRDEAGLDSARIIAISGYPENPALNEASGINGHLLKPVGLDALKKLLGVPIGGP